MIRVLIADDSAFMRMVLSNLFTTQSDFEVVGTAINGKDAVEKTMRLKPDLLTMDVNMPVMDGLMALEIIMKDAPLPVVMLSSVTKEGADATVRALELGAVDFISKTGGAISRIDDIEAEILEKCHIAAGANIALKKSYVPDNQKKETLVSGQAAGPTAYKRIQLPERRSYPQETTVVPFKPVIKRVPLPSQYMGDGRKLVAIGTSTGGPKALQNLIMKLPKNLPCGVVIVQHMPAGFTKSLAERLDTISEISVKEAENHDIIEAGHVYIAPGDYHMTVEGAGGLRRIALNQEPPLANHRPAVDVLFNSVVQFGRDVVSVILTGMGSDGSAGMKKIKNAGGYIIAEDASTAVVYGMPKAVADMGIADEILPLQNIAHAIVAAVQK